MANRYETIEILRTELGKRYKKTIRYPKMVKQSDDMYIKLVVILLEVGGPLE